jgi:thermolysin
MVYGDGDQNLRNNFSGALDVVAHELTHGITNFSSNLIYCNESGALSESFSDIMGVSVEFYYQARGPEKMQSDWYIGEDVFFGEDYAIRSFARPTDFGDPDHYANRYQADCRPETDNGGVHINSSIPNHAFYLFVMGGKRAPTGEDIDGIGFENLEQAEKIFYRAFTFFLTPNSNFSDARQATQQAARELYGTGDPPYSVHPTPLGVFERQLHWAWDAVGVY